MALIITEIVTDTISRYLIQRFCIPYSWHHLQVFSYCNSQKFILYNYIDNFYCTYCEKDYYCKSKYLRHLRNAKHKQLAAILCAEDKEVTPDELESENEVIPELESENEVTATDSEPVSQPCLELPSVDALEVSE